MYLRRLDFSFNGRASLTNERHRCATGATGAPLTAPVCVRAVIGDQLRSGHSAGAAAISRHALNSICEHLVARCCRPLISDHLSTVVFSASTCWADLYKVHCTSNWYMSAERKFLQVSDKALQR